MKRSLFALAIVMLVTASLYAQGPSAETNSLTKAEREQAISYLKETQDDFLKSIKGLSDEQWKFKSAPIDGRWRRLRNTSEFRNKRSSE